jgi:DNA-binding IclR family transcriptional regulator
MAGSQIERALSLLESLTSDARGLPMQSLADQLDIPKSATHRMLAELIRLGYVRQDPQTSRYRLSTKLVALGLFRSEPILPTQAAQTIVSTPESANQCDGVVGRLECFLFGP